MFNIHNCHHCAPPGATEVRNNKTRACMMVKECDYSRHTGNISLLAFSFAINHIQSHDKAEYLFLTHMKNELNNVAMFAIETARVFIETS